ncbi:PP2C family serine/threonine-protein phosphatase [Aerosakkonema funiforme]|uniref:PP2C family serine/threonine-protein phosphatase n=1 Tax=Aerosakkonema funiforme TaxID=1246630 RepID=UPI0035B9E56A
MNRNHADCWRVVAASVAGTSHEKTGKPCQDAHAWKILPEGVLVAAVADGAGSAAMAEVGADVAVGAAVEAIENSLSSQLFPQNDTEWKLLITNALISARTAVEIEATIQKVMVRDLASTLIVVVATPELVAAVQVGDGAAVVADEGEIIALTLPSTGEYINETTFLISPDAVEKAQVTVWHGKAAQLGILTDGLQMLALKMPEGTPHKPFFSPLFRFVAEVTDETAAKQELVEFLHSPRVTQRADDDLTILLATLVG